MASKNAIVRRKTKHINNSNHFIQRDDQKDDIKHKQNKKTFVKNRRKFLEYKEFSEYFFLNSNKFFLDRNSVLHLALQLFFMDLLTDLENHR